jgi:hypothetical protein
VDHKRAWDDVREARNELEAAEERDVDGERLGIALFKTRAFPPAHAPASGADDACADARGEAARFKALDVQCRRGAVDAALAAVEAVTVEMRAAMAALGAEQRRAAERGG